MFNCEALKGVAVCQHSLILSSFFKIDCTVDPAVLMLCKHWTGFLL